jgi:putative ABC transport system substrate-binding protein
MSESRTSSGHLSALRACDSTPIAGPLLISRALAAGAAKHKVPFVFSDDEYVMAGGLIALGPGHYEGYHGAAKYVDKILHGANPADLPIAGPTEFTMSANRTALKNLGLSLPPDLADRVSEWFD